MTTASGTYTFDTSTALDDHLSECYSRIGIRGDQITLDKIYDAERSANLLMVEWNNKGQNQFQLALSTIPLSGVAGLSTSGQIPASAFGPATIQVFSSILLINSTGGITGYSVPMIRLARADYEVIPSKSNVGRPDRYFWDTSGLTIAGNYMQLWPLPDSPSTYTVRAWTFQRIQDVGNMSNLAPVKYEWLDAFDAGLTARLAEKYAPSMYDQKLALAEKAWMLAVSGGRERGPSRFRVDARSATSWR